MNTNRIYSRKIMGLDYNVWYVFIILSVLSIALLSYKLIDKEKCISFTFKIKTLTEQKESVYLTGENLTFISSNSSENYIWDFGDRTEQQNGWYVNHTFSTPGVYIITATTGENCEWEKTIKVVETQNTLINESQRIIGPASLSTSIDPEYVCTLSADSYQWSVRNFPKIKSQGKGNKVKFHFSSGGNYTIQVTLDNDRLKTFFKQIIVEDLLKTKTQTPEVKVLIPQGAVISHNDNYQQSSLPIKSEKPVNNPIEKNLVTPPIEKKEKQPEVAENPVNNPVVNETPKRTFRKISDATFLSKLQAIQENQTDINSFDSYLCDGQNTKVIENNKKTTFSSLIRELTDNKKINLTLVHQNKDPQDNCVISITVEYEKNNRGLIDKILGRNKK